MTTAVEPRQAAAEVERQAAAVERLTPLERLEALCGRSPTRVGISATTKPIEVMTRFLTGVTDEPCTVIDEGHARERDLTLELPGSPLEAIMAAEVWVEEYDRLAELIRAHRTTLVFVNTRRHAERAARFLAERLGEDAEGGTRLTPPCPPAVHSSLLSTTNSM